jgi:hypothetical protein
MKTTIKLTESDFIRLPCDVNGNPRYYLPAFLVHEDAARAREAVKYRGKNYGEGWVFQTYNLKGDIETLNA